MTSFVFVLNECDVTFFLLLREQVSDCITNSHLATPCSPCLCLLHLTSVYQFSSGDWNAVYSYGLPELTRDILERIKLATGQPINENRFFPIFAASSKDYEIVEHQPFTKTVKSHKTSKNSKLDGGHYLFNKGDDESRRERDHFYELGVHEKFGNELLKQKYGDHSGKEKTYNEERYYKKNHHKSTGGQKGGKSKKGKKHGKFHVEKGFRDIYHKDEEKKSDFYWNNQHEEGKWIEYGFKNQKKQKTNDKGDKEKKGKSKTEESNYEKKENNSKT